VGVQSVVVAEEEGVVVLLRLRRLHNPRSRGGLRPCREEEIYRITSCTAYESSSGPLY